MKQQIAKWLVLVLLVQEMTLVATMITAGATEAEIKRSDEETEFSVDTIREASDMYAGGYIDFDYGIPASAFKEQNGPKSRIAAFSISPETTSSLPLKYGEENLAILPSMKDQNPYGICWAFSALGACEASMIMKGLATKTIDLSERHLAYYFYNKNNAKAGGDVADLLGGTRGDYNAVIDQSKYTGDASNYSLGYLKLGGNSLLTIWHLASWCGPVNEEMAPYPAANTVLTDALWHIDDNGLMGKSNSEKDAYGSNAAHLQNGYILDISDSYQNVETRDTLKKLIMEYGSLGIGMYSSSSYADSKNNSYYYDGAAVATNHAVQVIGWDDTFSKDCFLRKPAGDGAWLIKNSWGEETPGGSALNGYFWMSYYDKGLQPTSSGGAKYAFVFDCENPDNYDHIYQYDGDSSYNIPKKNGQPIAFYQAANVFEAKAENDTGVEILQAVGIGSAQANLPYVLDIYTVSANTVSDNSVLMENLGSDSPEGGQLVHTQEGIIPYVGYHTVVLDEQICLQKGQTYVVSFTFPGGGSLFKSVSMSQSPWKFVSKCAKGQSYVKESNGDSFRDCYSGVTKSLPTPSVMRIKAYTNDLSQDVELKTHELYMTERGKSITLELKSDPDVKPVWKSSDESVVTVSPSADGKSVTVTICGFGVGQIEVSIGKKKDVCQVRVDNPLAGIYFDKNNIGLEKGNQASIVASFVAKDVSSPATEIGSLIWSSSNPTVASVTKNTTNDKAATIVGLSPGEAEILVTSSSGLSARTKVTVTSKLTGISLSAKEMTLKVGQEQMLVPSFTPLDTTDTKSGSWDNSNRNVVSTTLQASSKGVLVKGLAPGKAIITYTSVANPQLVASCEVNVLSDGGGDASDDDENDLPAVLKKITLNKTTATITAGEKLTLTATQSFDKVGQEDWVLDWSSSDEMVAKVSQSGVITAKQAGTTIITAANGKLSDKCVVTVKPAQASVSKAVVTSAGKLKLTWEKQTGVSGYKIYRATSQKGTYKLVKTISGASKVSASVATVSAKGKPYYYKVRSFDKVAGKTVYGSYSAVQTAVPSKVSGLQIKTSSKSSLKLAWKKNNIASGYEIYRATSKSGKYKLVKTIRSAKTVAYTNKSLKSKKKYYYKIRAYKTINGKKVYGAFSAIITAKTK